MKNIIDKGKDIVCEIKRTGNTKLLFDLFNVRTKAQKYHVIHDEFLSYGIFDDIAELVNIQAFNSISTAAEIAINQNNENLFTAALSLLLTCVERSNTTEIPSELLHHWKCISKKVCAFASLKEELSKVLERL